jgi:hypothetical protein
MRSHISVQRATTKYFSNSFVFKNKIEKEGLPRDSPAALGAGGPEFKSRRPDQSMVLVSRHLETSIFLLKPLRISQWQEAGLCNSFNLYDFAVLRAGKNSRRQERHSKFIEWTQLKRIS